MSNALKILLVSLFVAALLVGCGTEEEIINPTINNGDLQGFDDLFLANYGMAGQYFVYTPPNYDANMAGGYNTLYLLNGFGGNETYWNSVYKAQSVLDKLISTGEIEPLIVVMPSGYSPFGGNFYTNSAHLAVGNAQQHILDLIDAVGTNFNAATGAAARAIGGHSMGGFGAVTIAIDNPDIFGSVFALSAPLSFDGTMTTGLPAQTDDYLGIQELLPAVLVETGYADVLTNTGGVGDAAQYQTMMVPTAGTISAMMFAMSAAFSPTVDPTNPTATTITGVLPDNPIFVDIPIGVDGQVDAATWDRWLAFDPTSKLLAAAVNPAAVGGLGTAPLFLDCGLSDDLGLHGAQQVFGGVYNTVFAGLPVAEVFNDTYYGNYYELSDGSEIVANHSLYIIESLERALIWQDGNLNP